MQFFLILYNCQYIVLQNTYGLDHLDFWEIFFLLRNYLNSSEDSSKWCVLYNNNLKALIEVQFVSVLEYISLTKPRIIVLLMITGIVGFFVPEPNMHGVRFLDLLVFIFIGYAAAGGAMTVNSYIDRDIDALMERTKNRPTLGDDAITGAKVLLFGGGFAALGIIIGWLYFNALTGLFLAWGVIFYLTGYSLLLKRKSILNTIIGGLASPTPVWVGYAARINHIPLEGWLLGSIVLIWTPSHTWALSTKHLDDYIAAGIPMLPAKIGMEKTGLLTMIMGIVTMLYGTYLTYYFYDHPIIFVAMIIPDLIFLYGLWMFYSKPSKQTANQCFKLHNVWLGITFTMIVLFLWV